MNMQYEEICVGRSIWRAHLHLKSEYLAKFQSFGLFSFAVQNKNIKVLKFGLALRTVKRGDICIHIADSLPCIAETHEHCKAILLQ